MAELRQDNDFKEGLKATGLFGGVQIFKILISIINTKFVAVLLGPTGIGIQGLLNSTTGMISNVSGLGLGTSAVRDVSAAYSSGEQSKFNRIVSIFRRLVWYTGLLGLLICAFGSPLWSKSAFGNLDYIWAFIILSITILLGQISSGQGVVLQGTRSFKNMAKSSIIGSVLGLFTGIPSYFLWGIKGIVPAMVLSSITSICLTHYYSKKIKTEKVVLSFKEVFSEGNIMLKMGVFVAIQSFLNLLCAYLVRIYISHTGTIADVGLYNSGFNIIGTYVGMVFTAMGTEYYPRLSSYANDRDSFVNAINQQLELALLLVAPLISFFLIFGELAITILYSTKFLGATMMIMWGVFGIFFKVPSWCIGFAFLAKGDSKAFFWNEFISEIVLLTFNISLYSIWGLNGLGISFLLGYVYYLIQCYVVCKIRYDYSMDPIILKIFIPQFILSSLIFFISAEFPPIIKYTVGMFLSLVSMYLAYKKLNKKLDVKGLVLRKFYHN